MGKDSTYICWSKLKRIVDVTVPSRAVLSLEKLESSWLSISSMYQMIFGGGEPYMALHSASMLVLVLRSNWMAELETSFGSGRVITGTDLFATKISTSFHIVVDCPIGLLSFTWHFQSPVSFACGL